jgi:FixJ family two-component response regulator
LSYCLLTGQLRARYLRESCTAALRQLGDNPRRRPSSHRMAAALFISSRTVEMHVHSSMQKLQCRTGPKRYAGSPN